MLSIVNLLTFKSGRQNHGEYVKCFLFWERIMEQTAESRPRYNHGVVTEQNKDRWMERQRNCLVPLLRRRMNEVPDDEKEVDLHPYIGKLFDHFCDQKGTVNLSCIQKEIEFMDRSLTDILFMVSDDGECAVNVNSLTVIFPNLMSYINEMDEEIKISLK